MTLAPTSGPILPAPSFAALRARLARGFPAADAAAMDAARDRQAMLTKPVGSLGRLEDLAVFMAGWQRTPRPRIDDARILVFAGNHGVCAQGVNPFPQDVTVQMVANFHSGGAAINQLARAAGAGLEVVALDLDRPTQDFTQGPAMTEGEVLAAMARGASAADTAITGGAQVLAFGEMGIGNSTIATALACARFGGRPEDWVGPGTGADPEGVARKARAVAAGVARHRPDPQDGLGLLAAFGGREQAAIAGAVLAARMACIPVILDGFICCAAAAVLSVTPGALDHCLAGHCSAEPGHARLLDALALDPILRLGLRLGEGTGAALALPVLRAAVAVHDGMATFAEAGVAEPDAPDTGAGPADRSRQSAI
ncbi:MAG: nicotinate-nucleotide--dimethylbenzimidazole phosphoribosyltransferase [Alkalilacustris sp.]